MSISKVAHSHIMIPHCSTTIVGIDFGFRVSSTAFLLNSEEQWRPMSTLFEHLSESTQQKLFVHRTTKCKKHQQHKKRHAIGIERRTEVEIGLPEQRHNTRIGLHTQAKIQREQFPRLQAHRIQSRMPADMNNKAMPMKKVVQQNGQRSRRTQIKKMNTHNWVRKTTQLWKSKKKRFQR